MNKMAAVRAVIISYRLISYRASTARDRRSKIALCSSLSASLGFARNPKRLSISVLLFAPVEIGSFLKRKNPFPIALHAHDCPTLDLRFIESFVQATNTGL